MKVHPEENGPLHGWFEPASQKVPPPTLLPMPLRRHMLCQDLTLPGLPQTICTGHSRARQCHPLPGPESPDPPRLSSDVTALVSLTDATHAYWFPSLSFHGEPCSSPEGRGRVSVPFRAALDLSSQVAVTNACWTEVSEHSAFKRPCVTYNMTKPCDPAGTTAWNLATGTHRTGERKLRR